MNRRKFLKGIGQSVLAGLFGGFVVAEGLEKFAEQKELEQQMSNSDGDNFDNTEWNLDWQANEWYHYPGIDNIITTGHHNCKCELIEIDSGLGKLSDEALLDFEGDKIELWGLSENDTSEILDHINEFYMKVIALGIGVSQEDIC